MGFLEFEDSMESAGSWAGIALILAIIGGILTYFLFIKNKNKFSEKLEIVRDLLDFKIMIIEPILKILYLIITIYIVLISFNLISVHFLAFILFLLIGVVVTRLIYEACLVMIMIWKNTKEINEKLKSEKKTK